MYRIGQEEVNELAKVIEGGKLFRVGSPHLAVENFEKEWADTVGRKYALCVNGGTSALIAGLVGLGVGPGDEVIVPGYTFMASAIAVLAVGAIPVITEIDATLTIDPEDVENKISTYTKAIMPVHMQGFPSDMERLKAIAEKHNLLILEDACQADGGSCQGARLGSWGNAGAFSFNDYKILSAGDAGCLVTDDRKVYERALIYHDGGATFRPYAEDLTTPTFIGVQNRVGELIGAVLRVQLQRLEGILADLRKAKKQMSAGLDGESNLTLIPSNDAEGDCGTTLGLSFESEETARRFAQAEGVHGGLPIDTGKHVYVNWEPILEKRGAHHPALDPFNLPDNQALNAHYTKDMCPKTLDILRTSVLISLHPDWSQSDINERIEACVKAGRDL